MSSFIDSGAGLVLSVWFIIAIVLNSENNFIIAKLAVWVWCGVAIMNGQMVNVFTLVNKSLMYMIKQLNYLANS